MASQSNIPARRYIVAEGTCGTVECAIRKNGRMEAKTFLESPQCKKHRAALYALFQTIVNQDPDDDEVRPKPLRGTPISEFKKGQVRIFCYRDGTAWVLTNGDLKKTNETPPENIERAERIRDEDLAIARQRRQKDKSNAKDDG